MLNARRPPTASTRKEIHHDIDLSTMPRDRVQPPLPKDDPPHHPGQRKQLDEVVPVHIEVLLPAFVLGCVLARPAGAEPHRDDEREGHQEGPESAAEQRVSTIVSGIFMVLVGLSMPRIGGIGAGWGSVLLHTLVLTALANLGKIFPLFCYRREASLRQRLALCIGMWPRGEVGAGVLVVSLGYGIGGAIVGAATMSPALNLLLTGIFILIVKRLIGTQSGGVHENRNPT